MVNRSYYKDQSYLAEYGWAILAAVVVIGVLAYFGIFYNTDNKWNLSQPSFNITQHICHNETQNIYYSYPDDFQYIKCPETTSLGDCYDSKGSKILGLKCSIATSNWIEYSCYQLNNESLKNLTLAVKYGYGSLSFVWFNNGKVLPEKGGFNNPDMPLKGTQINQVCEDKEVDQTNPFYDLLKDKSYLTKVCLKIINTKDTQVFECNINDVNYEVTKSE